MTKLLNKGRVLRRPTTYRSVEPKKVLKRLSFDRPHSEMRIPKPDLDESLFACQRESLRKVTSAADHNLSLSARRKTEQHFGLAFDAPLRSIAFVLDLFQFAREPANQVNRMNAYIQEGSAAGLHRIKRNLIVANQ